MTAGSISYTRGEDPLRADKLNASFSERVLVAGDTMTGPLLLSRAPVVSTEAATKSYVDAQFTGFLPITGGTLTGNLVLQNNLHISGPSGTTRSLNFDNSNLTNRWLLSASAIAESGGNVGSDFGITPAADNGAFLPTALSIKRSTGVVTIGVGLTVTGTASVIDTSASAATLAVQNTNSSGGAGISLTGNGATTPTKYIRAANGRLEFLNGAYNVILLGLGDQGRLLVGPSAPDDGTTMLQVAGSATVSGTLAVTGGNTISTAGQILAGFGVYGASAVPARGGFVGSWVPSNNNYQGFWSDGSGNLVFSGASLTGVPSATMGYFHSPEASFWVLGEAYKPSGGVWATGSDVRIKDVHGDYDTGLDAVCALRPRRYSYLGNDQPVPTEGAEPGQSPHARVVGREYVGLVAQEAEGPMPELVTKRAGLIDGAAVDDLRTLDASALLYALVNSCRELRDRMVQLDAFKELDARLQRLEARA